MGVKLGLSYQRKEHRLRMIENIVLRGILGPKSDGILGSWRRLHGEGLHNLYSSPNIFRMTKPRRTIWNWHAAYEAEKRSVCKV
jgi:hypothetical protein